MSITPHSGIIDFGTFTSPAGGADGIQGEVPAPLASESGYFLSTEGWVPGGGTFDPQNVSYLTFTGATPTLAAGRMWYDTATGAWNLGMGGGSITQQVGEELFVYGKASAAISDTPLQIVYQTGTVGASGVITFAPTVAGITDGNRILGIATEAIPLNSNGRITAFGVVRGIDTTGAPYGETWANGDAIWYNPVTGNPTKVKPVAPNIKVQVGTIITAGGGGSGSIQVEVQHGSVLGGTDSNVQITTPALDNLLVYNGANWVNRALTSSDVTTALGFVPVSKAGDTITGALTVTGQTSLGGVVGGESLRAMAVASSVNWLQVAGGVTGSPGSVTMTAQGADTNVDLNINPKGTGSVRIKVNNNSVNSGLRLENPTGTGYFNVVNGASGGFLPTFVGKSALSSAGYGMLFSATAGSDVDSTSATVTFFAYASNGSSAPASTVPAYQFKNGTFSVLTLMGGSGPVAVLGPSTSSNPPSGTLRTGDASGTDIGANNLILAAGRGTGTGVGGSLVFQTAAPGATSGSTLNAATERLRITMTGDIYGTAGSSSMAAGFIFIPAGNTPTGTPATYAGRLPLYYDSVNNKLYVYNGGWKASAAFA